MLKLAIGNGQSAMRAGSEAGEIFQHFEAHLLALFRVELGGHHVVAADAADEGAAVFGFGGDDRRIVGHHVVTVHEVDVA